MVPKYQAVVDVRSSIHYFVCTFARFVDSENIQKIQEHYKSVPNFDILWNRERTEIGISCNPAYSINDIANDLKELLNSIDITEILWKKDIIGDTVKSEDLEKVLAAK